jgi:hypothetical protein
LNNSSAIALSVLIPPLDLAVSGVVPYGVADAAALVEDGILVASGAVRVWEDEVAD